MNWGSWSFLVGPIIQQKIRRFSKKTRRFVLSSTAVNRRDKIPFIFVLFVVVHILQVQHIGRCELMHYNRSSEVMTKYLMLLFFFLNQAPRNLLLPRKKWEIQGICREARKKAKKSILSVKPGKLTT